MIKVLVLLFFLSFGAYAQDSFEFVLRSNEPPSTYLEKLKVQNINRDLGQVEKHNLCRLFIKTYIVSIRSYKIDPLIDITTPVYKLFKTNFPDVVKKEERGDYKGKIHLGSIVKFINILPDYKADIDSLLRER